MKTNIFYKVAAVTNSSPNLVEQSDTPSAEVTNCPPKLGGRAKRRGSVMAATFTFALSAFTFLAACSETDEIAPAYPNSPLTITATIPGDVWAVATRAEGEGTVTYSDWTLHYTDYTGQAATGTLTATSSQDGTYTLTTDNGLVWAKVNTTNPMHLTARCDNGTPSDATDDYTLHTSVPSATAGEELAFPDMKHTLAKFTVNFMFSYNMEQNAPTAATDFTMTISSTQVAADSYDPMTNGGAWPAAEDETNPTAFTLSYKSTGNVHIVTGSMLLPQQTMGETLTVTYKETTWTLNLNAVAVTEGQKANQLIAGQHLTLSLKAGLTAINTPSDIQIEAFTAADADDYNPDLGGVPKTYEYDAANYTYYIYHEKFIEAALADRAANNPEAAIVYNGLTLVPSELASDAVAVVSGIETNLATVQTAISGKTHIIATGTELAAYSGTATTVVGEAIRQLTIDENGDTDANSELTSTISFVMPDATTIGDNAFNGCSALKTLTFGSSIKSLGTNAFSGINAEISYNGISLKMEAGKLKIVNVPDYSYGDHLPAIIANGSLCVKVDGTCGGKTLGNAQHINMMKSLIQSAVAKGVTGVYVTGAYLTKVDSSAPGYLFDGPQTVLGMAISQLNVADSTIDVFLPEVETIPDGAFNWCPAIKNITYGQ